MLLISLITLIAYRFPVDTHYAYDVNVGFEGYLPVLHGRQSLADLAMTVDVAGATPSASGNPRMVSEIKAFKLKLNGANLPFGPANIKMFFPKTTIEATVQGKLLKTDAPNLRLPVHLPGLDVKRFPDITYLPIEFPNEGIEEGKSFKFQRPFGDGPIDYDVTPTKIESDSVKLSINITQMTVTYEDDKNAPCDEAKAATKITTELTGSGEASFSLKRGLVTDLNLEANSLGHAVDIKTNVNVERKLKTTLKITLESP